MFPTNRKRWKFVVRFLHFDGHGFCNTIPTKPLCRLFIILSHPFTFLTPSYVVEKPKARFWLKRVCTTPPGSLKAYRFPINKENLPQKKEYKPSKSSLCTQCEQYFWMRILRRGNVDPLQHDRHSICGGNCLVHSDYLGKGSGYFSESQGADVEIIDLVFLWL